MSKKVLVTDAPDPDLDGVACIFAYSEYLNQIGKPVVPMIFGTPQEESGFVLRKLDIKIFNGDEADLDYEEIILVDTSGPQWQSKKIDLAKVVEIIDHRKFDKIDAFPNAKVQIELVGSCATLIAEKFMSKNIIPSEKSSILLYLAIVSNTINFKNKITTDRDIAAAKWLKELYNISDDIIQEMFEFKSNITQTIREIFLSQIGCHEFAGKRVSTFQLEIIGVKKFIADHLVEIKKELKSISLEENYDFVLFTLIDIQEGHNTFVVFDEKSEELVSEVLDVTFENGVAHYPHVIMRKEILPKLKSYLESKK